MIAKFPPQLVISADLSALLFKAALKTARAAARHPKRKRQPQGGSLSPGTNTPMWNALMDAVQEQLKKRGDRANLARVLGIPRQRVTEMLRTRTYLPDAERTLLLLVWLNARQNGLSIY